MKGAAFWGNGHEGLMNSNTITLPRKLDNVKLLPVSPLALTIGSVKCPSAIASSVVAANVTIDVTVAVAVNETVVVPIAVCHGRLGRNAAPA